MAITPLPHSALMTDVIVARTLHVPRKTGTCSTNRIGRRLRGCPPSQMHKPEIIDHRGKVVARGLACPLDYFAKYCRTFAAIWRSVILSTVSTPATSSPSLLFLRRFINSPFASPGPNIRMDCASRRHAITAL